LRKMHCPDGHEYDGKKFGRCPVCDGHYTTTIPAPTEPPLAVMEPVADRCSTCQVRDFNGFSCGQNQADGGCELYLAPGEKACAVCADQAECISQVKPNDVTCPGFYFVGWPEDEKDGDPEPEVPLRERKIKALLGTIGELEATESEKKVINSSFNSKITDLKESIIRLSREINDLDHPAPLPLFDHTAATAQAMENPKADDPPCEHCEGDDCPDCAGPKDGIVIPDEDGAL